MAYLTVDRLWHGVRVPLLRHSLVRPRAQAQLALIAGLSGATVRGEHGDLVLAVLDHHGATLIAGPVYVGAAHARTLLPTYFDATPTMLDHLLSKAYAQRRYDALTRHAPEEPAPSS